MSCLPIFILGAVPAWAATTGTVSVAEDAAADTALTVSGGASVLTNVPTSVEMLATSTTGYADAFSVALDGTTNIIFKVKAANVLDRETTSQYTINLRYLYMYFLSRRNPKLRISHLYHVIFFPFSPSHFSNEGANSGLVRVDRGSSVKRFI